MPRKTYPKHVFCIEGNWEDRLNLNVTVKPVLELLHLNAGVRFIYRDCSTKAEMEYLIGKWQQKGYAEAHRQVRPIKVFFTLGRRKGRPPFFRIFP